VGLRGKSRKDKPTNARIPVLTARGKKQKKGSGSHSWERAGTKVGAITSIDPKRVPREQKEGRVKEDNSAPGETNFLMNAQERKKKKAL